MAYLKDSLVSVRHTRLKSAVSRRQGPTGSQDVIVYVRATMGLDATVTRQKIS